jgi:hypothetical protein
MTTNDVRSRRRRQELAWVLHEVLAKREAGAAGEKYADEAGRNCDHADKELLLHVLPPPLE